jgi:hypothetical protein
MINRKFLFDMIRERLFGGKLKAAQVRGVEAILDVWEAENAQKDDRWLAYMLATAFHETATTMQPIKEYGGQAWYTKNYDVEGRNPARARRFGNTAPGDGCKYCGRGFVQLTWKNNYRALGDAIGCDLVSDPDQAMDLEVATKVMFYGMEHGAFTGRKLADYFNPDTEDWVNARRIINGLDRAQLIASYARAFYAGLSYTTG